MKSLRIVLVLSLLASIFPAQAEPLLREIKEKNNRLFVKAEGLKKKKGVFTLVRENGSVMQINFKKTRRRSNWYKSNKGVQIPPDASYLVYEQNSEVAEIDLQPNTLPVQDLEFTSSNKSDPKKITTGDSLVLTFKIPERQKQKISSVTIAGKEVAISCENPDLTKKLLTCEAKAVLAAGAEPVYKINYTNGTEAVVASIEPEASSEIEFVSPQSLATPIQHVIFRSNNQVDPSQVKAGDTIHLIVFADPAVNVTALKVSGTKIDSLKQCNETKCQYSVQFNVNENVLARTSAFSYSVEYSDLNGSHQYVGKETISGLQPFDLFVQGLALQSSNLFDSSRFTIGDSLLLNFTTLKRHAEKISTVSIAGKKVELSCEDANVDTSWCKASYLVSENIEPSFQINYSNGSKATAAFIDDTGVTKPEFISQERLANSIHSTSFVSDNYINPSQATLGNAISVKVQADPAVNITAIKVNNSAAASQKQCNEANCEYTAIYHVDETALKQNHFSYSVEYTDLNGQHRVSSDETIRALPNPKTRHLLNRTSFGASPADIAAAEAFGFDSYLNFQLADLSPEHVAAQKARDVDDPTRNYSSFLRWTIGRMMHSPHQLRELMTWFWDNHFSTDYTKNCILWSWSNMTGNRTLEGHLYGNLHNNNAYFRETYLINTQAVDLSHYDTIEMNIHYRSSSVDNQFRIAWTSTEAGENSLSTDKEISFTTIQDNTARDYIVPITNPKWTGKLREMRLYPTTAHPTVNYARIYKFNLVDSTGEHPPLDMLVRDHDNEVADNAFFREHAFGNFYDLLERSTKSPRMQIYLDNWLNFKENPNENLARELLELHTLGVDGGYQQSDVEAVARILTGWSLINNEFYFAAVRHEFSEQNLSFSAEPISAGGLEQGEKLLEILSQHPSTANFICTKLTKVFVSDSPQAETIASCAAEFLAQSEAPDQISKVLWNILHSAEFLSYSSYRNKIPNPLQAHLNLLRRKAVENFSSYNIFQTALAAQNYLLYQKDIPTGFDEGSDVWMKSPSQLLNRFKYNKEINDRITEQNLVFELRMRGLDSAKQIVEFFFDLYVADAYTPEEEAMALAVLGDEFSLDAEDAETKIEALVQLFEAMPRAQVI